jgi:hypothetical protein
MLREWKLHCNLRGNSRAAFIHTSSAAVSHFGDPGEVPPYAMHQPPAFSEHLSLQNDHFPPVLNCSHCEFLRRILGETARPAKALEIEVKFCSLTITRLILRHFEAELCLGLRARSTISSGSLPT